MGLLRVLATLSVSALCALDSEASIPLTATIVPGKDYGKPKKDFLAHDAEAMPEDEESIEEDSLMQDSQEEGKKVKGIEKADASSPKPEASHGKEEQKDPKQLTEQFAAELRRLVQGGTEQPQAALEEESARDTSSIHTFKVTRSEAPQTPASSSSTSTSTSTTSTTTYAPSAATSPAASFTGIALVVVGGAAALFAAN